MGRGRTPRGGVAPLAVPRPAASAARVSCQTGQEMTHRLARGWHGNSSAPPRTSAELRERGWAILGSCRPEPDPSGTRSLRNRSPPRRSRASSSAGWTVNDRSGRRKRPVVLRPVLALLALAGGPLRLASRMARCRRRRPGRPPLPPARWSVPTADGDADRFVGENPVRGEGRKPALAVLVLGDLDKTSSPDSGDLPTRPETPTSIGVRTRELRAHRR